MTLYSTGGTPLELNVFTNQGSPVVYASTAYDATNDIFTYTTPTLAQGFYALIATYDDLQNVTLEYSTLPFACPFDPAFTDVFGSFMGCVGNGGTVPGAAASQLSPTFKASPCIETDPTGACTRCVDDYDLVNGTCTFNTTCPDGKYFQFGVCVDLPADAHCATYDMFTGDC